MATLAEMAEKLRSANPENKPMALQWMAEQWWPDAKWLRTRTHNHNGGARVGGRVAGGFAGRMERAGLLRMCSDGGQRAYVLVRPNVK
jgi:hypothetical protein